jgi:hypothetical protein
VTRLLHAHGHQHVVLHQYIPKNKKPTYVRVVCVDQPKKTNPKRVRWTAGGDKVEYAGNVTTQTADIQTTKCLFNSVVSTPNGRFMTLDLKDFYLCSDLPDYEYVRIPMHMLPPAIVELYQLESKISDGYVYAEVRKGMCGLPQGGKRANDRLRKFLAPFGYVPCPVTPGLWKHLHNDLMFTLVVDNFGIRYTNKQDVNLPSSTRNTNVPRIGVATVTLASHSTGTMNNTTLISQCPATLPAHCNASFTPRPSALSMPRTITLHQPMAPANNLQPLILLRLDSKDTKRIQEVLGTLLYNACTAGCIMIPAIGTIAT